MADITLTRERIAEMTVRLSLNPIITFGETMELLSAAESAIELRALRDSVAQLVGLVQPDVDPAGINIGLLIDAVRLAFAERDRLRRRMEELEAKCESS